MMAEATKRRSDEATKGCAYMVLGLVMWLAGCSQAGGETARSAAESAPSIPYDIVTTTAMIADIATNVAGDRARVRSLMGPGVDPHLYQPTRGDISRLLAAEVVLYNGLNLEGKMSDTFVSIARNNPHVHAVTGRIQDGEPGYLLEPPEFAGHYDPHVWMDPGGWSRATEAVIEALIAFDAAGEATYRANGDAYIARLDELDSYARRVLGSIPQDRRVLVTAHDAFNYFARAYDMEVQGILGISTESETGLKRIEALTDMLVERSIPAVFVETSVPDRHIKALVAGAAAAGHTVKIGGALFSDAMGAPGTYEGTYVGMIDHNVTTIARALGGQAPEGGLNGRLGDVH